MKRPVVTITDFGLNSIGYYDWLVTGLGILAEQGQIDFRYRLAPGKAALKSRYARWAAKALARGWVDRMNGGKWCLEGTVDYGGRCVRFVFDITDHGDLWDIPAIQCCDVYFKCQLPLSFPEPLEICRGISRPIPPEVVANAGKVRSAMVGRPLSRSLDFRKNLQLLRQWEAAAKIPRTKRIFAYFGGDNDPEKDKYANLPYQHPNVKRARLVRFLRGLDDPRINARLVASSDPSLVGPALGDHAFRDAVGEASFNVNISGFSRSLPFRFIDSFLCGATVLTDSLAIGWYEPFDMEREVIDLGPMGYELEEDVNWAAVKRRMTELLDLPESQIEESRAYILDRYRSLWSPQALATRLLKVAQEFN